MRISGFGRCSLSSCVAVAMLAGCGALRQAQDDMQPPGAIPQVSATATHTDRSTSWMLPDARGEDLMYVSGNDAVTVYTYPGDKLVGKLDGFRFASGQCVDKKQNVYITSIGDGRVYEYAHGGKRRIKTLVSPNAFGCSIDPTTGNLAVTNLDGRGVGATVRLRSLPMPPVAQPTIKLQDSIRTITAAMMIVGTSSLTARPLPRVTSSSPSFQKEAARSQTSLSTNTSAGPAECNGTESTSWLVTKGLPPSINLNLMGKKGRKSAPQISMVLDMFLRSSFLATR
jgi:hypothetical protein